MATDSNLYYYRRYLEDPYTPVESNTQQQAASPQAPDPNLCYYRRYLDDPATCQ